MKPWQPSLFGAVLLIGSLFPATMSAQPATYTFDAAESWLVVKLTKKGLAAALAHDHVVRAAAFSGSVVYDPDDLSTCAVQITIPVEELTVDVPADLERMGMGTGPDEGDRAKIKKNMLAKGQLHAEAHPTITYQSTTCQATGEQLTATGSLTIRGVSKSIAVPLNVALDGNRFTAQGQFTVSHRDFGMKPYSAALGTIKNDDPLEFHLNLVATKR